MPQNARDTAGAKLLQLLNDIFNRDGTSILAFFASALTIFGLLLTFANALGTPGSLKLTLGLLAPSLLIPLAAMSRVLRWPLLVWATRLLSRDILAPQPQLLIGVGPGGAIVAGILAKILAERNNQEPRVWVIDRTFQWASNVRNVDVANTLNPRAANLVKDFPEPAALLVCSEVHTGNTLSEAIKYLNSLHIKHKTLSLVYAEGTAGTVVDYWLIRSDKAGILPWRDDPARNP